MSYRRIVTLLIAFFATVLLTQIIPASATFIDRSSGIQTESASELTAGLDHYQAERYRDAITTWEFALEHNSDTGDPLTQALVQIHLSLAHQHLGQWELAKERIDTALALVTHPPTTPEAWDVLGKGHLAQGNLLWHQGDFVSARTVWQRAERAFAQLNDIENQVGSRLNQARALQSLGLILQASETLETTVKLLQSQPLSSQIQVSGLQSLGNAYRQLGQLSDSQLILEQSLALAPRSRRSAILLDLGNTARAMAERSRSLGQDDDVITQSLQAHTYYQQSENAATSELSKAQAGVNALSLSAWQGDLERVAADWAILQPKLSMLASDRTAIQLQLQALQTVIPLQHISHDPKTSEFAIALLYQARLLGNPRLEALALGQISDLYAAVGQTQDAKSLAQQTITLADSINATDIRYRTEWHLGRLLRQDWEATGRQNNTQKNEAIAAYEAAYSSLNIVRQDLVGIDVDVQFSFQNNISPFYKELADLLLSPSVGETIPSDDLGRVVEVLDSLQRVELENYLRCNLSQTFQVNQAEVDPTAAVLYPIVLPDRLEVILTLPDQTRQHYTQPVEYDTVQTLASQMRQDILKRFTSADGQMRSQQLYDWLIRPVEADLATTDIRTLVFVLDITLRDVPLAALYDGQQYLIENYALAVVPGLQLLQPAPLQTIDPAVLAFGLSEVQPQFVPHEGFSDLQYVETELQAIDAQVQSQQFINSDFSTSTLTEQIQTAPFPIVHLATHGQFSSDPEQTFILTWNERLTIDQISQIFRQREETTPDPVELLVLSACETATGHRRASLGLAGIAVQSGARSTIASLWQVDDQATAILMSQLYDQLSQPNSTINRAEALRQAQLALLNSDQNNIPVFWAAFMLVGNWL